jgi:hypothetical protein
MTKIAPKNNLGPTIYNDRTVRGMQSAEPKAGKRL